MLFYFHLEKVPYLLIFLAVAFTLFIVLPALFIARDWREIAEEEKRIKENKEKKSK